MQALQAENSTSMPDPVYTGPGGKMGQVTATFASHEPLVGHGNPASRKISGTLLLVNDEGSARISVVQSFRWKLDPRSQIEPLLEGTYRIRSGTGAYQGASGSGTIDAVMDVNPDAGDEYQGQMVIHSTPA